MLLNCLPSEFSCPGKIFIIGEYTCLTRQPAIVSALGPRFRLQLVPASGQNIPFALASPGGQLLRENKNLWQDIKLDWIDSATTPMGLGSSSAQFLLSYALLHHREHEFMDQHLLETYWKIVGESQGLKPSGLDLLAQFFGGTHLLSTQGGVVNAEKLLPWNEAEAKLILVYSGRKEATHTHLQLLKERGFPEKFKGMLSDLDEQVSLAHGAWKDNDGLRLSQAFTHFQSILNANKMGGEDFSELVLKLTKVKGVLGAKGAGAQGGDCVLLLCESSKISGITDAIKTLGCQVLIPQWDEHGLSTIL